eukprot:347444-Rhodomonas_salina.2
MRNPLFPHDVQASADRQRFGRRCVRVARFSWAAGHEVVEQAHARAGGHGQDLVRDIVEPHHPRQPCARADMIRACAVHAQHQTRSC